MSTQTLILQFEVKVEMKETDPDSASIASGKIAHTIDEDPKWWLQTFLPYDFVELELLDFQVDTWRTEDE